MGAATHPVLSLSQLVPSAMGGGGLVAMHLFNSDVHSSGVPEALVPQFFALELGTARCVWWTITGTQLSGTYPFLLMHACLLSSVTTSVCYSVCVIPYFCVSLCSDYQCSGSDDLLQVMAWCPESLLFSLSHLFQIIFHT